MSRKNEHRQELIKRMFFFKKIAQPKKMGINYHNFKVVFYFLFEDTHLLQYFSCLIYW